MKKVYISCTILLMSFMQGTLSFDNFSSEQFIRSPNLEYSVFRSFKQTVKKAWTVLIYCAADNDLAPFARKNIIQLAKVGSNNFVNILVHLDILLPGKKKTTLRYYVEKDKLIVTNHQDPHAQQMDSGSPATLISACKWAFENFPSDNVMLVMWNHGIGYLEIGRSTTINPSELFIFNPSTNKLDLDRSVPFLDFITLASDRTDQRGICFDDSTGNNLTNNDLILALSTIQKGFLNNRKINIICFDACLMAMLEVASLIKPYADYMVASEEVELGAGYNYETVMSIFTHQSPDAKTFAKHIVKAYESAYEKITNDYTQSALDLSKIPELESIVDQIAGLIIEALKDQKNQSVKNALKASRHKLLCTHFDEPSYVDLHHLLVNIANNADSFTCNNNQKAQEIQNNLKKKITLALTLIKSTAIANTAGKNLRQAQGISIYFPEAKMHNSYRKSPFAAQNRWAQLIARYILT